MDPANSLEAIVQGLIREVIYNFSVLSFPSAYYCLIRDWKNLGMHLKIDVYYNMSGLLTFCYCFFKNQLVHAKVFQFWRVVEDKYNFFQNLNR